MRNPKYPYALNGSGLSLWIMTLEPLESFEPTCTPGPPCSFRRPHDRRAADGNKCRWSWPDYCYLAAAGRTRDAVFPVQSCTCRADCRSAGCCSQCRLFFCHDRTKISCWVFWGFVRSAEGACTGQPLTCIDKRRCPDWGPRGDPCRRPAARSYTSCDCIGAFRSASASAAGTMNRTDLPGRCPMLCDRYSVGIMNTLRKIVNTFHIFIRFLIWLCMKNESLKLLRNMSINCDY